METNRRVFSFHYVSFVCVFIFAVCMQYSLCDKVDIAVDHDPNSNDHDDVKVNPKSKLDQSKSKIHGVSQQERIHNQNVDNNNGMKMANELDKENDGFKGNVAQMDMGNKIKNQANGDSDNSQQKSPNNRAVDMKMNMKISESAECASDVKHYCAKAIHSNNFALLECLQEDIRDDGVGVSEECQHFLWMYKHDLTKDERFFSAAKNVCQTDLHELGICKDHTSKDGCLIPCIIEHQDAVTDKGCRQFLKKMTSVVFSDWLLTKHFVEGCTKEIEDLKCGRVDKQAEDEHSQMSVLICLEDHVGEITNEVCHKQILRLAELQSDDYHLDRPLFYACHDVREIVCDNVKAGEGRVYDCLFKHKFDDRMTEKCREQLVVRQQVIGQDVQADKSFYDACKKDIKKHNCKKHSKDESESDFAQMTTVLLCLENALKEDHELDGKCIAEMNEWRRSLMDDYQINPELVSKCAPEIKQHCKDLGPEAEGRVIQCLLDLVTGGMDHRKHKNAITVNDECQRELENLLKAADIGEDYRMDPALERACETAVQELCTDITPGDARVLGCLMERMDDNAMPSECVDRLLEIQYFVARDFRLDHALYKACKADSQKYCHGQNSWADTNEVQQAEVGPLTLPCLYRNRGQLEKSCEHEVKRVMHARAHSVQLIPGVEEACMRELSTFCHDKTGPGQEMNCLQNNYEELQEPCRQVVINYTAEEEEDLEMDPIMAKFCMPIAKKLCADLIEEDADGEEILDCLIENKEHQLMKRRCKSQVEHYEIMMLEDYHLSQHFREACQKSINKLCKHKTKKMDIVLCLSEHMRNDTVFDQNHRVDKDCRKQMHVELLSRSKTLDMDPEVEDNCKTEIKLYCENVTPGELQVIECLKKHQKKLRGKCFKTIFKIEEIETMDNEFDYNLMHVCKKMIKVYCSNKNPAHYLDCLKHHKDEEDFDNECMEMVIQRQIVQNTDYRLNSELQKACKQDVPKFCSAVLKEQRLEPEEEQHGFEGRIINCLEKQFIINRLSDTCHRHIKEIVQDAAHDYRQDTVLSLKCEGEINRLCSDDAMIEDSDSRDQTGTDPVEECLKRNFFQKKITDKGCRDEIARIILQAKADIHVDPLLHMACVGDIHKHCSDITLGEGKVMTCLLATDENPRAKLTRECKKNLDERRKMWEYAAKFGFPETMSDLAFQITGSPSRGYFAGAIFTIVGLIFIVGISCGRVTKRITRANKTK